MLCMFRDPLHFMPLKHAPFLLPSAGPQPLPLRLRAAAPGVPRPRQNTAPHDQNGRVSCPCKVCHCHVVSIMLFLSCSRPGLQWCARDACLAAPWPCMHACPSRRRCFSERSAVLMHAAAAPRVRPTAGGQMLLRTPPPASSLVGCILGILACCCCFPWTRCLCAPVWQLAPLTGCPGQSQRWHSQSSPAGAAGAQNKGDAGMLQLKPVALPSPLCRLLPAQHKAAGCGD